MYFGCKGPYSQNYCLRSSGTCLCVKALSVVFNSTSSVDLYICFFFFLCDLSTIFFQVVSLIGLGLLHFSRGMCFIQPWSLEVEQLSGLCEALSLPFFVFI